MKNNMKESEAIKELHKIRPRGGIIPQKRAEALDVAIWALENQIKINEAFNKWKEDTSGFYGADCETTELINNLIKILEDN